MSQPDPAPTKNSVDPVESASPALHERLLTWYDEHARDLPWRRPEASPWSVMVSEFMLQQTPVSRVLPVHETWVTRWPTPADLAAESSGEAVRAWGRLGYPRRALRLHAAATAITSKHGGEVPDSYVELLALPGIGDYTAAAITAFAFGQRVAVLDTNVRRVHQRVLRGQEFPPPSIRARERVEAHALLPLPAPVAATWSVAVMELGALVCTARDPQCGRCPVADLCAWRLAGRPAHDGPPRRGQTWEGTDRQCRGRILSVLRENHEPVHQSRIDVVWPDRLQRERCLASLIADGLVVTSTGATYTLP